MAQNNLKKKFASKKPTDFNIQEFDKYDSALEDYNYRDVYNSNTSNNREPIEKTKVGLTDVLKSSYKIVSSNLEDRIRQAMPNTFELIDEVTSFKNDFDYLKSDFIQKVQPSINSIKRSGRVLEPRVKGILPPKLANKYNKLVSETDSDYSYSPPSKEEAREYSIAAELSELFDQQKKFQEKQYIEDKLDTEQNRLIDRSISDKNTQNTLQTLDQIRVANNFTAAFVQDFYKAYLKKDLVLKYKHLFVAQDTLASVQAIAKVTEDKLEEIRHNTALPDIQKQQRLESLKEARRQRISNFIVDQAQEKLLPFAKKAASTLYSRAKDRFAEGFELGASGLDMAATSEQLADDMTEAEGKPRSAGHKKLDAITKAGQLAGSFATGNQVNWIGRKIFGKGFDSKALTKTLQHSDEMLGNMQQIAMDKIKRYREDHPESNFFTDLIDAAGIDVNRTGGYIKDVNTEPTEAASFDNQTRTSIVEIIPGYLAKILQQVTNIATGENNEELVFSRSQRDFLSESDFRREAFFNMGISGVNAGNVTQTALEKLRGAYSFATKSDDAKTFDELKTFISKFIVNSGISRYNLYPGALKKYIETGYDSLGTGDKKYIDSVFNGIGDETEEGQSTRKSVAQILIDLVTTDGRIDPSLMVLVSNIIQSTNRQGYDYLEGLDKYITGSGQGRYLRDLFTIKDGVYNIDPETLAKEREKNLDLVGRTDEEYIRRSKEEQEELQRRKDDLDKARETLQSGKERIVTAASWVGKKVTDNKLARKIRSHIPFSEESSSESKAVDSVAESFNTKIINKLSNILDNFLIDNPILKNPEEYLKKATEKGKQFREKFATEEDLAEEKRLKEKSEREKQRQKELLEQEKKFGKSFSQSLRYKESPTVKRNTSLMDIPSVSSDILNSINDNLLKHMERQHDVPDILFEIWNFLDETHSEKKKLFDDEKVQETSRSESFKSELVSAIKDGMDDLKQSLGSTGPGSVDIRPGDLEGDNKRDTVYEEQVRKQQEKKEKTQIDIEIQRNEKIDDILSAIHKLTNINEKGFKKEDGGLLGGLLGGGGGAGGFLDDLLGKIPGGKFLKGPLGKLGAFAKNPYVLGALAVTAGGYIASEYIDKSRRNDVTLANKKYGFEEEDLEKYTEDYKNAENESALSMVNAGYDAAAGWRDTTIVDNFLKKRAELYGIDASRSANGMWNFIVRNKDVDTMLDMEKAAAKARENKDISDNQLRKWAETFGFDVNDSEQFDYFARWFSYRFFNLWKQWYYICRNYGTFPKEMDQIPPETVSKIQSELEKVAQKHLIGELKDVTPYPESYKKFKGKIDSITKPKGAVDVNKDINKNTASVDVKSETGDPELDALLQKRNQSKGYLPGETRPNTATVTAQDVAQYGQGVNTTDVYNTPSVQFGQGSEGNIKDIPVPKGKGYDNVKDTILAAAKMAGVDPQAMITFAGIESSFNPGTGNSKTSAQGLYQFTDGTWAEVLTKYGPKYGIPLGTSKFDARANALMAAEYMKYNASILKSKIGKDPSLVDLYAAHMSGPGGGPAIMKAFYNNPNMDVISALRNGGIKDTTIANMINANRTVYGSQQAPKTVAQVVAVYQNAVNKYSKGEFKQSSDQAAVNIDTKSPQATSLTQPNDVNAPTSAGQGTASANAPGTASPGNVSALGNLSTDQTPSPITAGLKATEQYMANIDTKGKIVRPTKSNVVTSPFGPRNVEGGSKDHKAIDLRANTGDPIFAMMDGVVTGAGGSYNAMTINHGDGLSSRYLHLSQMGVPRGTKVVAGQEIGKAGGKGPNGPNQYVPHLHLGVYKDSKPIDPEAFLKQHKVELVRKGQPGEKANAPLSDVDAATQSGSPVPATGEVLPVGEKGEAAARKASENAAAADVKTQQQGSTQESTKNQNLAPDGQVNVNTASDIYNKTDTATPTINDTTAPANIPASTTPEVKPTLESTSGNVENLLSQILSELVKSNTNLATISEGQASFKSLETTLQSGFTTMSNYLAQLPSSSSSYVETDPASINRTQPKQTQTSKKEMKSRIPISPTKPALNVSKTRRQAANTTNSIVV